MTALSNAPVIIKRKKVVGGGGHHGGAWKVAYADFVTAMMAFFLLMWLLNATSEEQRSGIADYFNPSVPLDRSSGGGDSAFGGDSVFSEETLMKTGVGASVRSHADSQMSRGTTGNDITRSGPRDGEAENQDLSEVEKLLSARSGESMVSERLQRHIVTRVTDEGLIVELFDLPGAPLFKAGTDRATPLLAELTGVVSEVFGLVRNRVAIKGFVASVPVVLRHNPVWDQSTERAQTVRQLLAPTLAGQRLDRVEGHADRAPVLPDRMAVRNNRVELILLRGRGRGRG